MPNSYKPLPQIPRELRERYRVMVEVLSEKLTVSGGARRLGLSRNHFQTLLHRGQEGLVHGISRHPSGRPHLSEAQKRLQEERAELGRENERLRKRLETADRLLGLASGLLRGRTGRGARTRKTNSEDE